MEDLAARWFMDRFAAALVARNFRFRMGELDLVFEERLPTGKTELVFVEVRARLPGSWVSGVESVDFRKQRKLKRVVRAFLARYRGAAGSARFDLLGWDGSHWCHLRNVWFP